jgi:hypothetical protein
MGTNLIHKQRKRLALSIVITRFVFPNRKDFLECCMIRKVTILATNPEEHSSSSKQMSIATIKGHRLAVDQK